MAKANVIKKAEKSDGKYKFKGKNKSGQEADIVIEINNDTGDYIVEELEIRPEQLPRTITDPASGRDLNISWFTNFAIKKGNDYIRSIRYTVKLPERAAGQDYKLVIYYGEGKPEFYSGDITDNTITLTNGDPAIGGAP